MEDNKSGFATIDEYMVQYPPDIQDKLQQIRQVIRESAPDATEKISYQMPTFELHGQNLVHFAAFKKHTGFYPTPSGIEEFQEELAPYKKAKGSAQFPHDQPLPLDLVRRVVLFRAAENLRKAEAKAAKKRKN
ncbi:iron chaperone [Paenibacillus macerans]|uniref:iron chaperone n=1 Tax=Paenibacillus macerans TaxID=44252 RepID=UPI003D30F356